jgi:uncharacterized protein
MNKIIALVSGFAALFAVSSSNAENWCQTQKHQNKAEKAICSNDRLRDRDEALNKAYQDNKKTAKSVKSERDWIKRRNACGDDESCLGDAYRERLRELGGDAAAAGRSY